MRTDLELEGDSRAAQEVSITPTTVESQALPASESHSDRRTHVLFLIDQLCGIGGAERSLLNIVRFLPKNRFRCSVVTFKADPSWSGFRNFPCEWWHFSLERTYDWNALKVALQLRQFIRSKKVDIVHTFFESSDIWGGIVAKLSGVPVLISSRRDMGILRNSRHHFAYRTLAPLFDLVLTVSEEVRTFCIRHDGVRPEKILTLHNAIEIEKFPAFAPALDLRKAMGFGKASHLISTIGHVRRVKGLDVLIRAAKKVCTDFSRAVFVVIGGVLEQDHLEELQELIRFLHLQDNVKFTGPSEDVVSLLRISDVFCLASRSEGFSNALLEAMACGLPCVATRVGGNPEAVVDNESGFLVEAEDPDTLAHRILILLRQPALAKQMGRKGRRIVEAKFTVPTMISRLSDLYDRAI